MKLQLPIHDILPEILDKLRGGSNLVLQAPPGAGKTTVVPLAVLDHVCTDGLILVLQPRRIACIRVAKRLAQLWGDVLGETIGYRVRHESLVGNHTRLEVITEGVLVRMIQSNPTLDGVSCIFFDEFHERSLDSDLSFTLGLAAQRRAKSNCQGRHRLQIVVMSATLDALGRRVAALLGNCPLICSEGRCYPVEVRYTGCREELISKAGENGESAMEHMAAATVKQALDEHDGDILVFLPGEREIMYVWIFLNNMGIGDGLMPKRLVGWAKRLVDRSATAFATNEERGVHVSPLYATLHASTLTITSRSLLLGMSFTVPAGTSHGCLQTETGFGGLVHQ